MSSSLNGCSSVEDALTQIENVLRQACRETGYGQIVVDISRCNQYDIRIVIKGSVHYKYDVKTKKLLSTEG